MVSLLATTLLCLNSTALIAQSDTSTGSILATDTHQLMHPDESNNQAFSPFPLLRQDAGLSFNVAGSEQRKLQLHLTKPLSLNLGSAAGWMDNGDSALSAGASLDWLMPGGVRLSGGFDRQQQRIQFQPVGSIHCKNGILEAGSYRASGCYFTNGPDVTLNQQRISLGANYDLPGGISTSISMFRNDTGLNDAGVRRMGNVGGATVQHGGLITPVMTNPLLPQTSMNQPMSYIQNEASGVDVDFQLGFTTDNAGDVMLGLQLTRVLGANYSAVSQDFGESLGWELAESVDKAQLNFDWSKGAFSGGVQSFYREPVKFLNGTNLDAMTTFDVHFTWRTPWNASLSLGASNLLNAGTEESGGNENKSSDPFESIYGRIPYVRYKQDL
jgi:hypothetical protein